MKFSLHGGSAKEKAILERLAEKLEAKFVTYKALDGEEPLLVVECFPMRVDLPRVAAQVTQLLAEIPPEHEMGDGVQVPLPGMETPPCR